MPPLPVSDTLSTSSTRLYLHQGYECWYDSIAPVEPATGLPLLLIHPIGVGLSRLFWQRFCPQWYASGQRNLIYNPDLLGCGESQMPPVAYYPIDWAKQLQTFLRDIIQTPVIVVVQGALLPVAIELATLQPDFVRGLVLCGPPAWTLLSQPVPVWQQRLSWALFDSALGGLFYGYARRSQFLRSFSTRQLFASPEAVDAEWLDLLRQGSQPFASRRAVFSFLASFWRQDYRPQIAALTQPTLVVLGQQASSISRDAKGEGDRKADYLAHWPQSQGITIPGRNVLAYESPQALVTAIQPFVNAVDALRVLGG
jgi:pimeloyl-ACP methyl ester carboxylesterase